MSEFSYANRIAFQTIVRKEVQRYTRIWQQTLLPPAITITLYFFIFGKLIGSRIGDMSGVSYIEFVIPGLIMMSVITNSYSNVASSFFGAKFNRSIEEMLVSPVPNWIILMGFVFGGVSRGILVGIIVASLSLLFAHLQIHNLLVTVLIVVMTSIMFALAGFINAVFARNFDDISIIPTFVLTPLTYLGGIFYTINMLSDFWQGVSMANPVLYMVNAFRYGFLGISDINISIAFGMVGLFIVVLYFISLYLLKNSKGLRS